VSKQKWKQNGRNVLIVNLIYADENPEINTHVINEISYIVKYNVAELFTNFSQICDNLIKLIVRW